MTINNRDEREALLGIVGDWRDLENPMGRAALVDAILALFPSTSPTVTTVEELRTLDGQVIRARNGWVLTVEVLESGARVNLAHGDYMLDMDLWDYADLLPALEAAGLAVATAVNEGRAANIPVATTERTV